jgi:hypothetical protein
MQFAMRQSRLPTDEVRRDRIPVGLMLTRWRERFSLWQISWANLLGKHEILSEI